MRYLALIQARCGSSRLPNKVLMDIAGKPDIQHVIERVRKSTRLDEVMLITSIAKENVPLINFCTGFGTRVFVGAEGDVLDRYYQATRLLEPEFIVRITGDCPLFDWRYLDLAIESMDEDTDYLWMGENTFPDGLDFEIIRSETLTRAWKEARLQSEREHVTPYIRNHSEMFKIQIYDFPIKGTGHYRWTLDEECDYEAIQMIYCHFMDIGKEDFITEDVIAFLREHPEIESLNAGIVRNEGLIKSIKNDMEVALPQADN